MMSVAYTRVAAYQRRFPAIASQIEYLPPERFSTLGGVQKGILFVEAMWSVYSRQASAALVPIIARLDPNATLRFIIFDTDELHTVANLTPFCDMVMGGNGETFWIDRGNVIATTVGPKSDEMKQYTVALLEAASNT